MCAVVLRTCTRYLRKFFESLSPQIDFRQLETPVSDRLVAGDACTTGKTFSR